MVITACLEAKNSYGQKFSLKMRIKKEKKKKKNSNERILVRQKYGIWNATFSIGVRKGHLPNKTELSKKEALTSLRLTVP